MNLDLADPATRASFDAMFKVAARRLSPEVLVDEWFPRIEQATDLDQAADITTELCGLPMSDEERRIGREVRASLALFGEQL